MKSTNNKTTRRAALKQMAESATVAAAAFPILAQNPPPESHHSEKPITKTAAAYKYQFFNPGQLQTLDALTETIIPTDAHSPGAKAAHTSEYIDAIVSAAPADTRKLWTDGLAAVEHAAQQHARQPYAQCSANEQVSILKTFAVEEQAPVSLHAKFFQALKRATVDGYYTSAIGIHQDLDYQGNEALAAFPGCQHRHNGANRS